ncbi:CHA1 [Sanghuangporus weigelae]
MSQASRLVWLETPLILSNHLSSLLDCNVYLKLENLQPSQSFKYRGISLFATHCKATRGDNVHLIIASGGNAGLAAACAANSLGLKCTVYLPKGNNQSMVDRLQKEKAEVVVAGKYYSEAAQEAQKAVERDENACYVHGYDGPILSKGHSSMITEISHQLHEKPDAIFCSVGGGGLLKSIIDGCKYVDWDDVPIVAVETHGAAAFYHSMSLNESWGANCSLPAGSSQTYNDEHNISIANVRITSKASSLAATSPSTSVVHAGLRRLGSVTCVTIPDEMAMHTTCMFAEDHKFLAELACSATLSLAYHPDLFERIQTANITKRNQSNENKKTVVFIVCGGVKVSLDEVQEYEALLREESRKSPAWEVFCNGKRLSVIKRPTSV